MNHRPFEVRILLTSPFIETHILTLDGLLSFAVYVDRGLIREHTIPHIPLLQERGVFHGSALLFARPPVVRRVARVMALKGPEDLRLDLFAPMGSGPRAKYGHVDTKRGQYKSALSEYLAIDCPEVAFYGYGDRDETLRLLSLVPGVGKRANTGFGQIEAVSVTKTASDWSWMLNDGHPARPLPLALWQTMDGTTPDLDIGPYPTTVPYWSTTPVMSVIPHDRRIA